ncbi:Translocon-associated protein subunit gamma [Holothuria leucospilota]|uniref:Translocon-associated protein subunit gamma n=1 Tax=Holothuria leucospilota TaxID=206669 RepID=A0A9Q1BDG9_HOLLE|nr:Translocon-associated protein subunit gamma [Holothuria leucospilota]
MPSQGGKKFTREEELLLQDFSRNMSTKSSALFYGNALIVAALPASLKTCETHISETNSHRS